MSTIPIADKAARDLQILSGLNVLEKTIALNQEKVEQLQSRLNFVSVSTPPAPNEAKNSGEVCPPMSECARKLWEFNSFVYSVNRKLDEILTYLDL